MRLTLAVILACILAAFLPQSMATEELGDAYKFDEDFYDKIAATPPSSDVSG